MAASSAASIAMISTPAMAQNQTATVSPIELTGLPYSIQMDVADFGSAPLPTLQSYAAGTYDGKWILVGGRTNGMHSFDSTGTANFPPEYQNTDIWVIDPTTQKSWKRSLTDSSAGISNSVINALSATVTESVQRSNTLYVAGGYLDTVDTSGTDNFTTNDTLTALDLPGVVNWVQGGAGSLASSIRQTSDPTLQVTGGSLNLAANGKALLTFGQDFEGGYNPNSNGAYTYQVRTFNIVDDGTTLSIANKTASTTADANRRRDLNIVPITTASGGPALVALSGVFTTTNGAWTVPVEVGADGTTTMVDPTTHPDAFKQGMNGYDTARLVLYSPTSGENHIILLGGISLQTYNGSQFVTDNGLPFTSQGSSIVRDANGNYTQYYLGDTYPDVIDSSTNKPLLFGAESKFFVNPDLALLPNGDINMDLLNGRTLLGYVYGGIASEYGEPGSNDPGNESSDTAASNLPFEVWYQPVPEPGSGMLLMFGALGILAFVVGRKRRAA